MKLARLAALAALGLAAVAFAGVFQPSGARGQEPEESPGGLTVVGNGSATATPDRASFVFGTVSQARTAAAALDASSEAIGRVVAALQRAGVARADLQTSEVSISARWNDEGETIVGYTASNSVTSTIRRLGEAGTVIDAAVAAGANQVSGPSLLASDQANAYREALRAAVADARAKAQTLAAASSVGIGAITAVVESGAPPMPLAAGDSREALAAPIEPGTQEIEATVSVTFELR